MFRRLPRDTMASLEDDEFYTPPRGRPVLGSVFTSLITTVVAFVALTVADHHGLLDFLHGDAPGAVEVPSVNGVTVEQARELLRAQDLLLTLQGEHADPAIPAGKVGGQVPFAGSRAQRGSAVQAYVSTGAGDI